MLYCSNKMSIEIVLWEDTMALQSSSILPTHAGINLKTYSIIATTIKKQAPHTNYHAYHQPVFVVTCTFRKTCFDLGGYRMLSNWKRSAAGRYCCRTSTDCNAYCPAAMCCPTECCMQLPTGNRSKREYQVSDCIGRDSTIAAICKLWCSTKVDK